MIFAFDHHRPGLHDSKIMSVSLPKSIDRPSRSKGKSSFTNPLRVLPRWKRCGESPQTLDRIWLTGGIDVLFGSPNVPREPFICFLLYLHVIDALSRWDCRPVNWCVVDRYTKTKTRKREIIRDRRRAADSRRQSSALERPVTSTGLAHNSNTMSMLRLTELPIEILEQILLHLPGQDVFKMEAVRHVVAIPHNSALTFHCDIG